MSPVASPTPGPPSLRARLTGRLQRGDPLPDGAVLVLRDVTKTYPNGKNALREVDLVIPEGDFVFLVGEDLARVPRRNVPRIRRKIGTVFQDFKLLPSKSVRENVAFVLEVTGTPRRQIRPAVERVLALVGLTAQASQTPVQLSGG